MAIELLTPAETVTLDPTTVKLEEFKVLALEDPMMVLLLFVAFVALEPEDAPMVVLPFPKELVPALNPIWVLD
jgi:hypothetical protein